MLSTMIAGHLCLDLVPVLSSKEGPRPGELVAAGPLQIQLGGCVGNTGVAMFDMGLPVTLAATVGNDQLGEIARAALSVAVGTEKVNLEVSDFATSYSVVFDPPGGDRSFIHHVGSNSSFSGDALVFDGIDLLHLGYPTALPMMSADGGEPLVRLFARARDAGVTTSLDLSAPGDPTSATRDWAGILGRVLPLTDVVSPSLADLRALVGELADADADTCASWLVVRGAAVAIVTDGPNGAVGRFGDARRLSRGGSALTAVDPSTQHLRAAAPSVVAARTTGAGDVASAGLLAAIARGLPPTRWIEIAVRAASARVAGQRLTPGLLQT